MDPGSPHEKCTDAVERLYHYLDRELDDIRMTDVQRHLDDCLPCLEAFDFELTLRQVVARKCRDQVPDSVRIRILLAIQTDVGLEESGGGMVPPL